MYLDMHGLKYVYIIIDLDLHPNFHARHKACEQRPEKLGGTGCRFAAVASLEVHVTQAGW